MYFSSPSGFSTSLIIGVVVAALIALVMYATRQLGHEAMSPVVQSHRSFTLRSDASSRTFQPGAASTYTFSIVDDQSTVVKDFVTVHDKIMHVIVVRKDLEEFQHVHSDFNTATGKFTLANLTFPSDGPYRIFTDFTPLNAQLGAGGQPLGVVLHEDVTVGNMANYKPQALDTSLLTKEFSGYQVHLAFSPASLVAGTAATFTFTVNHDGRPVIDLEEYLGALGHAVVLREGDLEFLHTHALDENIANQDGKVNFAVTFTTPGKYKVFGQFQHQGKVLTTDFVVSVGEQVSSGESKLELDIHNMH